jgi:hypothetical protein
MLDPETRPLVPDDMPFETAQEVLTAAGLDDGLPLVPPTAARLAAMLAAVAEPDRSLGALPPLFGDVTAEDVAYQCVIAGAPPGVVPLVLAAALACLEDELNLLGLMTTTGAAAIATIVHGPVVGRLGLNAGINCLGPGNRANATIGRAISLVLRNIGGARPGTGDMATVGQPGKFTFCCAESPDGPLAPLHARRGLPVGRSAVTVLGVSGTAEILPDIGRDSPEAILDPVARMIQASLSTNGAGKQPRLPEQIFLLPPELAGQIVGHGWDLSRIQRHLFEATGSAPSPRDIHPVVTGGPGVKMAYLPLWGGGTRIVTRAIG